LVPLTKIYVYLRTNTTASRKTDPVLEAIGVAAKRVPILWLPDAGVRKFMIFAKVINEALKELLIEGISATRIIGSWGEWGLPPVGRCHQPEVHGRL
jgi:hypothetical protein